MADHKSINPEEPCFRLHSIWHIFLLYMFRYSIWHSIHILAHFFAYILAFYLAYTLTYVLPCSLTLYLSNILAFYLAVEVQRCSLHSDPAGSGPAVLTVILSLPRGLARSLANRISETLGKEDWRGGLARRRRWQGGGGGGADGSDKI